MEKVIVIGSGIGGLSSAVRLARKGFDVTVFESNSHPGGKLHAFKDKGYHFDYGPSLFTMPQYVDELFELFDLNPRDFFNYKKVNTVCNYFWSDGTTFSAPSDFDSFAEKASRVFADQQENIRKYLLNSKLKYESTASLFLHKSLHKINTYASKDTLKGIATSIN
ncbi:MAG: FAD-dependent oxidoreductase [Bacteroidota bacterium]